MSDIVDRLRSLEKWIRHPTGEPFNTNTGLFDDAADIITRLEAENERLRAGGCARDQSTTQYCAEAARLVQENEKLRAALEEASFDLKASLAIDAQKDAAYEHLRAALEEATAELIYLRLYGKDGAVWLFNDSKEVWREKARAALGGEE